MSAEWFEPDDIVRCVDASGAAADYLVEGREYKVRYIWNGNDRRMSLVGIPYGWGPERFEMATREVSK